MKSTDRNGENGTPSQKQNTATYYQLLITDESLAGIGIAVNRTVIVRCIDEPVCSKNYIGKLLCFINRHGDVIIGRYVPPYVELPYKGRTLRIRIGDRRIVGVVVGVVK